MVRPTFSPPSPRCGRLAVMAGTRLPCQPPASHRAAGSLACGPRYAVRTPGCHHWSPFPVRLDVRNLEPRGHQDLRRGPGDDADNHGETEELAVERGGAAEPADEEQQRHDLDEIRGDRGHHRGLRAVPRGPAHRDGADAEEDNGTPEREQGAQRALDATENGAQRHHYKGGRCRDQGRTPEDHGVTCQHLPGSRRVGGRTDDQRVSTAIHASARAARGRRAAQAAHARRRVSETYHEPLASPYQGSCERYHKLLDEAFTGSPIVMVMTISDSLSTLRHR